ncbi:MAG: divalent metal cation transporter [Chloroflexi bacterium]|nr:divalent metal cation transporter [Chloroflexota bacterium]
MGGSGVVAYFIILASGATLFVSGQHTIATATDAAEALRPIAGDLSAAPLTIGIIGAGVLAVPILTTSAASGISGAAGWRFGLDRKWGTTAVMAIAAIALVVTTVAG